MQEQLSAAHTLHEQLQKLSDEEKRVLARIMQGERRNINKELDAGQTLGERVADQVAAFGGSWTFIFIFLGTLIGWIIVNTLILTRLGAVFDPYPFILLNLLLSMIAAIQAPIILMSQNRQSARDRMDATNDYEVNLKAEMDILTLHEKLDDLRDRQWADLVAIQQKQIELLERLLEKRGEG